jgi:pilus assembly protein CpaB
MRQRSLLFVILAVFFTVGTIYFARVWLAKEHAQVAQEPVKVEQPSISVLVAAHDLATGSFIRPEDLRWQAWPDGPIADNYLLKDKVAPESLSGAVVKQRIAAGEPVTGNRMIKPGDRGFLAAVLSPGMRAVSVPVTPISDVSGLVFAGDHVDVILAHQVKLIAPKGANDANTGSTASADETAFASETILTDLRILAIDQSTGDVDGKPILAKTVTFEVTPKQVEAIEVASTIGTLYLSLRGLAGADAITADAEDAPPANGIKSVSHTWDSDLSPLIRHEASQALGVITILRGEKGGGGGTTSVPLAAPSAAPTSPSAPARTTSGL